MAASYDPSLNNDKDHVRLLINDTDTSGTNAFLADEEIEALLREEGNKHLAAARALGILSVRWSTAGDGIIEKQVGGLRVKYGQDQSAANVISMYATELRKRGAFLLTPTPRVFRVVR